MIDTKDLNEWNDTIFQTIVAIGRKDKSLFLYLDSDILAEISNLDSKEAQRAFASSFLKHYKKGQHGTPFENAVFEALNWPKTLSFKKDSKPIILPLLALSVIAVTDKSPSRGHSVYSLLNNLLGLNDETEKPAGYEFMPEVWEIWNRWLRESGSKYGKPTARVINHYALQGYARSQGFIRRRDRVSITDFFSDSGILPGTTLQKEYLTSLFETWLRGQGKKELPIYKKIYESGDETTRIIFSEILVNELENWDGLTQTESGGDSVVGYLARDNFGTSWEVVCDVQKKLIGTVIDLGDGPIAIDESWPLIYVSQIDAKEVKEILKKGTVYKISETLSIKVGGRNYYLFANGKFNYSGFVEERNPKLFIKYSLLVESNQLDDMCQSLDAYGATYEEPKLEIETGFYEISNLTFTKRKAHNEATLKFKFPINPPPKISLFGGLQIGKNQYESNYPPILQLPFESNLDLSIDGKKVDFSPDQDFIDLRNLKLQIGSHEIQFGESKLIFFLVEYKQIEPKSSSKGISLVDVFGAIKLGTSRVTKLSDKYRVRGALLPNISIPTDARFLQLPYEYSYVFLLQDNEDILRQIQIQNGFKFTKSKWRVILSIPETRIDLSLLENTFSGEGYLIIKEASSRKCTILRMQGKLDPQIPSPRYMSKSANKAIESILLSKWSLNSTNSEISEKTVRDKLTKIRLAAPMTPMVTSSEMFEKVRNIELDGVQYGPLDFLLEWISEQDNSFVTFEDFESAWNTLDCKDYHKNWQESASYLEHLGHLEMDFESKRVCMHPAVANILPGEGDFAVLVGSRPFRMQEILAGNATDFLANPAEFKKFLDYKLRYSPRDYRNTEEPPTGPAIALLKSSDFFGEKSQKLLRDLGIEIDFSVGRKLLRFCPTVSEIAYIGQRYDLSPSNKFEKFIGFQDSPTGYREHWSLTNSDNEAGIYRYIRDSSRKIRAVRFRVGEPLYEIDAQWARYVFLAFHELFPQRLKSLKSIDRYPALLQIPDDKLLFVPNGIRLPKVISQGLVLQTGIPHETYEAGTLYHNIGRDEVSEISRILEFNLIQEGSRHVILEEGFLRDLYLRYGVNL